MKLLIVRLEALFCAMTLLDDCRFKRGLQIRPTAATATPRGQASR